MRVGVRQGEIRVAQPTGVRILLGERDFQAVVILVGHVLKGVKKTERSIWPCPRLNIEYPVLGAEDEGVGVYQVGELAANAAHIAGFKRELAGQFSLHAQAVVHHVWGAKVWINKEHASAPEGK